MVILLDFYNTAPIVHLLEVPTDTKPLPKDHSNDYCKTICESDETTEQLLVPRKPTKASAPFGKLGSIARA